MRAHCRAEKLYIDYMINDGTYTYSIEQILFAHRSSKAINIKGCPINNVICYNFIMMVGLTMVFVFIDF